MSTLVTTEALVLHSRRWSESSKIVTCFTRERGYLNLLAKGAYRPKSPFSGVLETLNHLEIIYSHRESRGLQILSSASLLNAFHHLREDLSGLSIAFAALELIQHTLRQHEPVPDFFDYTIQWLNRLDQRPGTRPLFFLVHFLLQLGKTLGFAVNAHQCMRCGREIQGESAFFVFQNGALVCKKCHQPGLYQGRMFSPPLVQKLQRISRSPEIGQTNDFTEPGQNEDRLLVDALLEFLRFHVESPVQIKALTWLN